MKDVLERMDRLEASMNKRFDRLEIAVLDLAGRVVATREVEEIKARMSSGAPPTPAPRAAKSR